MPEVNQRFVDLEVGKYCIVPCVANIEEKDTRFLLRVLIEPNGLLSICKRFEVIQNFKGIKDNDLGFSKETEMKKPDLARSTCPNFPNCEKSRNPFQYAYILDLKCGSEVVTYDTKMWHEKCFKCHKCGRDLSNYSSIPFLEKNSICNNCSEAWKRSRPRCKKCFNQIEGNYKTVKGEPFHNGCYKQ